VQQERIYDQNSYDALAQSLLAGRGYSFEQDYWYPGFTRAGEQTAHWSFLYPAFLAGVYAVFGHYPLAARLVQVLISGILSTWLFYRLGKRLAGNTVGLITAGLGAVYIYFVYHDAALMTESFFTLGVLAIFVLSFELVETGSDRKETDPSSHVWIWLLLGLVMGLPHCCARRCCCGCLSGWFGSIGPGTGRSAGLVRWSAWVYWWPASCPGHP
jgi:hypothetical protein